MHKRLVAGLSRLVTCLQSNFIGTNFAGFCSNLGVRGLFSSPFVSYWAHIDWLAPGYLMGAGNPTISRKRKPRSGLPASPGSPTRACLKLTNGLPSFVRTYLLLWREEGRKRNRHGCGATALNQAGPAGLSEEAIIKLNKVGRQDIFIVKERSVHEGICTQLKDALELYKQLNQTNATWNVLIHLECLSYNE